jgi:hypothetical protein
MRREEKHNTEYEEVVKAADALTLAKHWLWPVPQYLLLLIQPLLQLTPISKIILRHFSKNIFLPKIELSFEK